MEPSGNRITPILYPITVEEFLSSYWGKSYLFIQGTRNKFSAILTLKELEEFVLKNEKVLHYPRITMYHDGNPIPEGRFTKKAQMRISGAMGYKVDKGIDSKKINALFQKGATFKISQLDQVFPRMKELCDRFVQSIPLIQEIHLNFYYSASQSQAFRNHFDKHDVFVLQISGSKTWEIFDYVEDAPLLEYKISRTENYLSSNKKTVTLNEGDLLYIPRGQWHNAYSTNSSSSHLTIGIRPKTAIDLLYFMERSFMKESFFRQNIVLDELQKQTFKSKLIEKMNKLLNDSDKINEFCMFDQDSNEKMEFH